MKIKIDINKSSNSTNLTVNRVAYSLTYVFQDDLKF